MYTDNYSLLRILTAKNIGNTKAYNLVQKIKSNDYNLNELIKDIDNNVKILILNETLTKNIKETKEIVDKYYNLLQERNIIILNRFSPEYPTKIISKLQDKAPLLLFCKGNTELLNEPSIGFCGSREATEKGLNTVQEIINFIGDKAIYVSGYAKGVDLKVHSHALQNNYKTIIVLPEGILNFKLKKEVKNLINWDNTLVISEFLPNSIWSVGNAMQRNSTIISLSKAMVLIEAKEHGGSYNAGLKSLELSIPLYAPRYNEDNESNKGNLILARNGAKAFGINKNTKKPALEPLIDCLQSPLNNFNTAEQQKLFGMA